MDEGRFSISPQSVYERLGTAAAPLIVDVRHEPASAEAGQLVVGAIRRTPETVEAWASGIPAGRSVAVYCVRGHEVSQNTAAALASKRTISKGALRPGPLPVCRFATRRSRPRHSG